MSIERRKYFRIKDTALVMYRVIQDSMLETERRGIYLNQIKRENARAALFGLETRLQDVFENLRPQEHQFVEALELLNRKINLLERVVSLEQSPSEGDEHFEHEPKSIDVSGGGMAITADSPLAVGTHLAIDLVLLPNNDPMRIFGSVVDVRQNADANYTISIAFEEIRQEDQDHLIQHVLRRQSSGLRAQRQAAPPA
jgi:c-di-GMP-binding flagellar brake protein YcgR